MTKLGLVFWGGLVLASGFATFNVKYAVQGIDEELARVRRQTLAEQQETRVLTAEWAYLNQPERLAELNRSLLQLAPVTAKQLQARVGEIALRPLPAPAPALDMMIAANATAAAPVAENPPAATLVAAALPGIAALAGATPAGGAPAAGNRTTAPSAVEAQGMPTDIVEAQLASRAGGARTSGGATNGAAALAKALRLLGIDAGKQRPPAPSAEMPAVAEARAGDFQDAAKQTGGPQVAEATVGARSGSPPDGAAALAEAMHLLGVDGGGQAPRVRLAKATPSSLDALISKIVAIR